MPLFTSTTTSIAAAILGTSSLLLRRRISKNWIKDTPNRDLTGKTIVITGGNVGLGYETAKDFSSRNAKRIILACRDVTKGRAAAHAICAATGKDNVECLELDLASLVSVRKFTSIIDADEEKFTSIDTLVCNAGVWVPPDGNENSEGSSVNTTTSTEDGIDQEPLLAPPSAASLSDNAHKTNDGYEIHFGVNHLSHFLLATELQDKLAKSENGDARIIFVSSSLMKSGKIDMDAQEFVHQSRTKSTNANQSDCTNTDTTTPSTSNKGRSKKSSSFGPPLAYCDSKLMNALTSRHLSTILPPTISTYSVCPGFCRSRLGRNVSAPFYKRILVAPILMLIQRTAQQGAQNIIYTVVEEKEKLENGAMYRDGSVAEEHMEFMNSLGDDLPRKLFELSKNLVK